MKCQGFYQLDESTWIFCIKMRNDDSNSAFYSYKISNPVVNEVIFFTPKKY